MVLDPGKVLDDSTESHLRRRDLLAESGCVDPSRLPGERCALVIEKPQQRFHLVSIDWRLRATLVIKIGHIKFYRMNVERLKRRRSLLLNLTSEIPLFINIAERLT